MILKMDPLIHWSMGSATMINRVPSLSSNHAVLIPLQFYFNPDLYIQGFGNRKGRGTVSITHDPI